MYVVAAIVAIGRHDASNMHNLCFITVSFVALLGVHVARTGPILVSCRFDLTVSTNRGHKKTSLRVPSEAVGIALVETRREVSACALSSACAVNLETSYISLDDRFAAQIALSRHSP